MRIRTLAVVVLTVAVALAVSVAGRSPEPAVGTWKANLTKSKYVPGPAPKSSTSKIVANADGSLTQTTDAVEATGAAVHYEITFKFDGKDYPYKGTNPNADSSSYKRIDDHTYDVMSKKGGKATVTSHVTYSADGKIRTVTQTGMDSTGKAAANLIVYDRQP